MADRETGKVWLVGAGPSDVELITVKGKRLLEMADVIVYDRLVGQGILTLGNKRATYIDVGKRSGYHPIPQQEINRILVEEAGKGQKVVRLKGGDPFVFGRGAEEAKALAEAGVLFEVVPGVTSAVSVPAYQGIPVTCREVASSLHIITAHKKDGSLPDIQYEALARTHGTLVFLMGVHTLGTVCQGLLKAGMDEHTPAVILERGTTARQRKIEGNLTNITERVQEACIVSPAIILVGEAAGIKNLEWYEKRPLAGRKIMVTRPREQMSRLAAMLREEGAEVLELPAIRTEPVVDKRAFRHAVDEISEYQWMVFTSPTGVRIFMEQLREWSVDIRKFAGIQIGVIGPGTARELAAYGLYPQLMPDIYDGEHLGRTLAEHLRPDEKAVIFRASMGNEKLTEALGNAEHAEVKDIAIYDTFYETFPYIDYKKEIEEGLTDYVIFTSASTVRGFARSAGDIDYGKVKALCIGQQTKAEALGYGMEAYAAEEPTLKALLLLAEEMAWKGRKDR